MEMTSISEMSYVVKSKETQADIIRKNREMSAFVQRLTKPVEQNDIRGSCHNSNKEERIRNKDRRRDAEPPGHRTHGSTLPS